MQETSLTQADYLTNPSIPSLMIWKVERSIPSRWENRDLRSNINKPINLINSLQAKEGDNLLDIAINNDIDIDGFGACEGTLACSTCHVIFTEEDFAKIDDEATDEELDMLDLAFGLTDTSRLGCQVCMSKALDGVVVKVPAGVNDQR